MGAGHPMNFSNFIFISLGLFIYLIISITLLGRVITHDILLV
jgi:hypothetical protein